MKEAYTKIVAKIVELMDYNLIEENEDAFRTLQKYIQKDYIHLIDLTKRIKESSEEIKVYEEDHIILDHILDSLETFVEIIKIIQQTKDCKTISSQRAKYLLKQVLQFEFEELDTFEFPDPKEWAINTFDIDEEEYDEIFKGE